MWQLRIEKLHHWVAKVLIGNSNPSYRQLRTLILRSLGFIYLTAFAIVFFQGPALWGKDGLLPIDRYIGFILVRLTPGQAFWENPSLFYFFNPEWFLPTMASLGIVLSIAMILGFANFWILLCLWLFQLSLVNSGQLFYSYGWETQILEFTFLAFFFTPFLDPRLKNSAAPAPRVVIWGMRWMLFRLMIGAGLIKIRGDECWRDLTCLIHFYETQPNPHPFSYFFHLMPDLLLKVGVVANHFVELIVPFGFFGPARLRRLAGVIAILFQFGLIAGGNLSWLNWLTIVMCLACFDDEFLGLFRKLLGRPQAAPVWREYASGTRFRNTRAYLTTFVILFFTIKIISLSWYPTLNLISDRQAMNTSYDGWHLVNSYGAFGSVGKDRYAVMISATTDTSVNEKTNWQEYEFKCAPGDVKRRPCLITPYHYHLDWQMWFSAMYPELREEWLYRLTVRLLEKDPTVEALFQSVPFKTRPTFIKMDWYLYKFAKWNDWPGVWWERKHLGEYMPPTRLEDALSKNYRSVNH